MANLNSNPRGGLTVDRDSLHASDGYKRQIAAMELMKESEMAEKMTCTQCGMPCDAGEYHPYAACLMFTACHNSETVRANLAQPAQAVDVGAIREVIDGLHKEIGESDKNSRIRVATVRTYLKKLNRAIGNAQAEGSNGTG